MTEGREPKEGYSASEPALRSTDQNGLLDSILGPTHMAEWSYGEPLPRSAQISPTPTFPL